MAKQAWQSRAGMEASSAAVAKEHAPAPEVALQTAVVRTFTCAATCPGSSPAAGVPQNICCNSGGCKPQAGRRDHGCQGLKGTERRRGNRPWMIKRQQLSMLCIQ